MQRALHLATLASLLGMGACTSLLGVDGTYEAGGGGDAGAASSTVVTATTTSAATATVTVTSSSGGGAGGADGVGGAGATVTTTGAGGGDSGCPVCVVLPRALSQPQGHRPRIAHLASELTLSFINGGTVQIRRASGALESESAAGATDALLTTTSDDSSTELVWTALDVESGAFIPRTVDDTFDAEATIGVFDATRASGSVYVATDAVNPGGVSKPVLFACNGGSCVPNFVCPGAVAQATRKVGVSRWGDDVAFARECNGDLIVSDVASTNDLLRRDSLVFDRLALTSLASGPVVATLSNAGLPSSTLQIHLGAESSGAFALASANDPTITGVGGDATLVVFTHDVAEAATLGAVYCADRTAASCAQVALEGAEIANARSPSLGTDTTGAVWLAWERDGDVHLGQLGP